VEIGKKTYYKIGTAAAYDESYSHSALDVDEE